MPRLLALLLLVAATATAADLDAPVVTVNGEAITLRALETLKVVDVIYCEDTRVTAKLLARYEIKKPLKAYHDHNGALVRPEILSALEAGQSIALVSDAGTPLIADPGYKLVREALAQGHKVVPIPGPAALLPALQLSVFPTDRFYFGGFLQSKSAARKKQLQEVVNLSVPLVFYDTPKRLASSLADIEAVLGADCQVSISREITKAFEEHLSGTVKELKTSLKERPTLKGELVLVLHAVPTETSQEDLEVKLKQALSNASLKDAVAHVVQETGLPRRAVYQAALALNHGN